MFFDLVADIGGTNARFALSAANGQLHALKTLPTSRYTSLEAAVRTYLADCGEVVQAAAIAIANPVSGDIIRMTNHHWAFSIADLRQRMGWSCLEVLNDFTAQALAVLEIAEAERYVIRAGVVAENAPIAVLGPGTGLGVSGLIRDDSGHWTPLSGEGGHVSLPIRLETEYRLWQFAHERFPGHLSAERFLSGSGIALIDQALASFDGKSTRRSAAEVTAAALDGERRARLVIDIFGGMLGDVAANLALTLGARGGVYLGGGILPRIRELFAVGPFVERFASKGRMSAFLQEVPVFLVLAKETGLRGAVIALRQKRERRKHRE